MEKLQEENLSVSYTDLLEFPDLPHESVNVLKSPDYLKNLSTELIKKSVLNLFLDVEKKNNLSISDSQDSHLHGVVIGESSKKSKLYERFHDSFSGFDTKGFVNLLSSFITERRDRSSLLETEKRDHFDFGRFKVSILSFGDFFIGIIYQSAHRSLSVLKLEKEVSLIIKAQNYLDASVLRNTVLDEVDQRVGSYLENINDNSALWASFLKLFFLVAFTVVTLNKVYEWNVDKTIQSDPITKNLDIDVDRSLLLNTYIISGFVPDMGYRSYLTKILNKDGVFNIRWKLQLAKNLNFETAEMRLQVLINKLNNLKGYKLKRKISNRGLALEGFVQSPNQLKEIERLVKQYNIVGLNNQVKPNRSVFIK